MKKLNKKNSLNSNRSFGLLFFIIFFLYGIWPLIDSSNIRSWSLILSLVDSLNQYDVDLLSRSKKINLNKEFMAKISSLSKVHMRIK